MEEESEGGGGEERERVRRKWRHHCKQARCVMVGEGTHLLRLEQAMHHPPRFKMVTPPGQAQLPGRETQP